MKGLILKDFYMMKKYMKMNILMLFLLAALIIAPDNTVLIIVPYLILLQMPISLIGYEENCGWDAYATTLPCTKKRQVDEKFLLSLAIQAVSFVLVCIFELAGSIAAIVACLPYALPIIGVVAYLALWKTARRLYCRREK